MADPLYQALRDAYHKIDSTEVPDGQDSLLPQGWTDWIPATDFIESTFMSRENVLQKLSEIVANGENLGDNLTAEQKTQYDIAKKALDDYNASATPVDPNANSKKEIKLRKAQLSARSAAAGGDISDKDTTLPPATDSVRMAHQCFLLYNITAFSNFHKRLLEGNTLSGFSPAFYRGIDPDGEILTGGYYSQGMSANTISAMSAAGLAGASLLTTVPSYTKIFHTSEDDQSAANKLGLKKHGNKFLNMQTPEISQLMPKLRIFKVYREENDKSVYEIEFKASTVKEDGLSAPLDLDHLGGKLNNFTRGDDVGVKSFSWEFIGSDPFTATREIAASLTLTAQHFGSYVRQRLSSNVVDGSISRSTAPDGAYRYLDLVLQPDCRDLADRNFNYKNFSPECYEIRVEVGYSGGELTFGTFDSNNEFKEAVNCHKDVLMLSPTDHQFQFGDDGSVELTINLRGRLDAMMNDKSMNVLLPSGGGAGSAIRVSIKGLSSGQRAQIPALKGLVVNSVQLDVAERAMKYISNNKKSIADVDKLEEILSTEISKTFTVNKQLFMAHIFDKLDTGGAVFWYNMTSAELDTFTSWETDFATSALPSEISDIDAESGNSGAFVGTNATDAPYASLAGQAQVEGRNPLESGTRTLRYLAANSQESLNERIELLKQNNKFQNVGAESISYFFLGDLISVVFDSVTGDNTFDSGQFRANLDPTQALNEGDRGQLDPALGRVEQGSGSDALLNQLGFTKSPSTIPKTTKNVLDAFRIILGNIRVKLKSSSNSKVINLSHIPISVQAFNNFMIDNVLASDSDNYTFFEFINDLLTSLVINTLGTKCFGGISETTNSAQAVAVTSPVDIGSSKAYQIPTSASPVTTSVTAASTAGANYIPNYKVVDLTSVTVKNPLISNCREHTKNFFEYTLIGMQSIDNAVLNGNYEADLEQGIYHIAYGIDRGLVKTMKFSKTNQEFLPEAQFASEGGLLLNQLANVFDVTIEMTGNNLFKIGQYLYIDAEALGAGPSWADFDVAPSRKRSFANIMGLGGYHLITEIANYISGDNGVYTTTIKARWQDPGTRDSWPDLIV
tara:strand:- start:1288 stop:4509 length:3222 start_codon:yes stop_codon:yes gene_type:complete